MGGIDILVLNHAITGFGRWSGTADNFTSLHREMDVNFFSYVELASHAIAALGQSSGSIIVLNSGSGKNIP